MSLEKRNRPSALLASGSAGGTIAAVRHLAARGIDVRVISSQALCAAAWSRHVLRSYAAPSENENRRFLDRLLAIGKADPGQILLPTSDETAWLYTLNASLLERFFRIYQPSIDSMWRILDKKLFADAASRAGLAALPTWNPRSPHDLTTLAPTLPYPILIKPRTHVHRVRNYKGVVVHSANELIQEYQQFVSREQGCTSDIADMPEAGLPILQKFVSVGSEGVHSVTGFLDRTGELFVTRRATKVLQRTRPVGVGICFEPLPADPALSHAVLRLCKELGYFGIFEVEFVLYDGRWAAIDFNPRFFNQMGMDIRRGMPLPLLACLAASGEEAALRDEIAKAHAEEEGAWTVFCNGFTLRAILLVQTITSRISFEDRSYWRDWMKQNALEAVDYAADVNDPMPGIVHALSEIYLGLKALPQFLKPTLAPPGVLARARS